MFGQKLLFHPPLKFPTHFCQNNPFKVSCQTCMQMRNTLTQSSCGQTLLPAEQTWPDRTSYTWQKALVSYSILLKHYTALNILYCILCPYYSLRSCATYTLCMFLYCKFIHFHNIKHYKKGRGKWSPGRLGVKCVHPEHWGFIYCILCSGGI